MYYNINAYSGFQWATASNTKKADSTVLHVLAAMAIIRILIQITTDNAPVCVSSKIKQCFEDYNIKYTTGVPRNTTAQAVKESFNLTLKDILIKQKVIVKTQRG